MTDEKVLCHRREKHWKFTFSKTPKGEEVEDVIGLLVLIALIAYFLIK